MGKLALEKGQKPAKPLVNAPKDRVKSVKQLIKVEKKEKPTKKQAPKPKKPFFKKEADDEAPVRLTKSLSI